MKRTTCLLLVLFLPGCGILRPGIPDAGEPLPKVKPCERVVILHPDETVICMTNEEFGRAMKGVLY